MTRVLVVDDEPTIVRAVGIALQANGYEVTGVSTAGAALSAADGSSFALIVLDLGLPDLDGLELLRRLRAADRTVPIVVLSAWQDMATRVSALDQGADDFVPKPFGMPELLARIRVALRHARQAGAVPLDDPVLDSGSLRIDTARRLVTVAGGEVTLTRTQYQLLLALVRSSEKVVTHRMLAHDVWGPDARVEPENLRVVVSQVRKRLADAADAPPLIVTELGVGYRFVPDHPSA